MGYTIWVFLCGTVYTQSKLSLPDCKCGKALMHLTVNGSNKRHVTFDGRYHAHTPLPMWKSCCDSSLSFSYASPRRAL